MWYDRATKGTVWWYAVCEDMPDTQGFPVVDFEGGLYAAAISKDGEGGDGERVYAAVKEWIASSDCFVLDEWEGHFDMYHIVTPPTAAGAMGLIVPKPQNAHI